MNIKNLKLLLLIVLSTYSLANIKAEEKKEILIFPVDPILGRSTEELTPLKVEAALNLACIFSEQFKMLTPEIKDSLINEFYKKGQNPTPYNLSAKLNCDFILFTKVDVLKNVIRIEVTFRNVLDTNITMRGIGFDLVRWRSKDTDINVLDLSLVNAAQRAFAVAWNDTNMYINAPQSYRVYPGRNLVVCGLEFKNNSNLPNWSLFDDKEVASFDIVETIFETASLSNKYVSFDTDTRDAIYNLFNLYIVENFNTPTITELNALEKLGVEAFIAGTYVRTPKGANIELRLFHFEDGIAKFIKSVNGEHFYDNLDELRFELNKLTTELLELN